MGLAGRKQKQRIGIDPRNTTWADDAARFGKSYLEKFGWSSGTGLGVSGDGRTSHLKVMQKLDLMGIGANRLREGDEGGQGREYEKLLRRLNENATIPKIYADSDSTSPMESETTGEEGKPKKKRKRESQPEESEAATKVHVPRPMAHRSKFLKSKNMAKTSQTALNEILGITTSTSASASTSATNTRPATPIPASLSTSEVNSGVQTPNTLTRTSANPDDLLTTSTTSVADYFAQKLAARKNSGLQATVTVTTIAEPSSSTPSSSEERQHDDEEQKEHSRKERKKGKKEKRENLKVVDSYDVEDVEVKEGRKDKKSKKRDKKEVVEEGDTIANPPGVIDPENGSEKEKGKKKRRRSEK